jgi:serine protease Do
MVRKELVATVLAGAVAGLVVSTGAQFASAEEAVNPTRTAPAAVPGSFADIIARVAPAVVSIEVERETALTSAAAQGAEEDPFGALRRLFPGLPELPAPRSGPTKIAGSGFFVSADGYIVTNNHVVEGARRIIVRTRDERTMTATLIGRDPATDLAVVKVNGSGHPYVDFEVRAQPRVGDWVVALGNPFGLGGTATAGIVSALKRPNISGSSYVDFMQIDAPINRGNSGGPTFDVYGRVVGVNSAIFSPSGGSVGIGFDIPADVAARVVKQLIATGKVTRGYIGASVQDVTPAIADSLGLRAAAGALVAEVTRGGPSDRAGLKMGDIVEAVDGRPVASAAELTRAVALIAPGRSVRLRVRRGGSELTLTVTSGERPSEEVLAGQDEGAAPEASGGALGLVVTPQAGGGLQVEQVNPNSDAARKGMRPGDVIRAIAGRPVGSAADVAAALRTARAEHRKAVLLRVERRGRTYFVAVEPAEAAG